MADNTEMFPPHTRGWTFAQPLDTTEHPVSPAHAGMDLIQATYPSATGRFPRTRGDGPQELHIGRCLEQFPRTRGDGPVASWISFGLTAFPPHTRGWTVIGRQHVQE